jgi:hypothetical protein
MSSDPFGIDHHCVPPGTGNLEECMAISRNLTTALDRAELAGQPHVSPRASMPLNPTVTK